jgi:phosphatidylglycerol:prolipoprotein diacylglycerol transferase
MFPILLKLGPLSIHAYGFFIAVAFMAGILLSYYYVKKEGLNTDIILELAIYGLIAAIVGSRLFYVIGQWDVYRDHPLEIIMVQNGGLVFLGGLLLAILATIVYARIKNIPLLKLLDVCSPVVSLGYAIARVGCFLNGCCFGIPTKLPWGINFPPDSLSYFYFPGEKLHPTQIYSLLAMLAVFGILGWMYERKRFDGQIFFWWMILYSVYRFAVEFFRFSPIHWVGLTPSQWMVIFTLIFGVWGLLHYSRKPGA